MTKAIGGKHPVILREKATGNRALDSHGYSRVPHLFFVLANKYDVPPSLLLTLLSLWDRTVGTDAATEMGDCALSQIPVKNERDKLKWLAAFEAAGFFSVTKPKSGGAKQQSTLYEYKNPLADDWDEFFRRAGILARFENWEKVSKEKFGQLFADISSSARRSFSIADMIGRGLKPPKKNAATVRLAGPPET